MKNYFLIVLVLWCLTDNAQTKKKSEKSPVKKETTKKQEDKGDVIQEETAIERSPYEDAFNMVEEMPQFPGGDAEMMKFIRDNLKFPESAKKDSVFTGCKTFIKFIVGSDGKIRNEMVARNCIGCMDCDIEAIRVISSMPVWKPGKQGGKAVAVNYVLPIFFNKQ